MIATAQRTRKSSLRTCIEADYDDDLPQRIAIHETGHIVVARKLRLPAKMVTLLNDPPIAVFSYEPGQEQRYIMTLWAGHLAEIEFYFSADMENSAHDRMAMADVAHQIGLCPSDVMELHDRTVSLIQRHRDSIKRVADALLQNKMLLVEQVDELLRS